MKFFMAFLFFLNFTVLSAYELDGDISIQWTGFKTEKKIGVSGTFKTIKVDSKKSKDFVTFVKSINVEIPTKSFDSKNPFRDKNIVSTLFKELSAQTIFAGISHFEANHKRLMVNITMNRTTRSVPMVYELQNNQLIAKGKIDILDFKMKNAFIAFAQKCAVLHHNRSFSDVVIEFTLPYKD